LLQLRTCTHADTPLLVEALNECLYKGYRFKVVMTPERFLEDSRVHDIDLDATYLALDRGSPKGIALVAHRSAKAWIAGMGVHPSIRGRGLGTELLRRVQSRLLEVREIELEVLVENTVARRCYSSAGFVAQRRYFCFRGTANRIPWSRQASKVVKASPQKLLEKHAAFHQARACWQRNFQTLVNRAPTLKGLMAIQDRKTVATLLFSESAISDVGWKVDGHPLERPLHDLLHAAFGPTRPFAIVNVPSDDPLCKVMHDSGFEVYAEQLDMLCEL
jgi:GNAT superfamily N-acetyltransferase